MTGFLRAILDVFMAPFMLVAFWFFDEEDEGEE